MREAEVKERIKAILRKRGVWFYMPVQAGYGEMGIADFICCFCGRLLAIEAKSTTGKPTALQIRNLSNIMKAGGASVVINDTNLDRLDEILDAIQILPIVAGFGWVTLDKE